MAQRRKTAQLKAGRAGGFENVEATSTFDLMGTQPGGGERSDLQRWVGLTGKFATPTWQEVVQAGMMEIMGTGLLTALVVLGRWYNVGSLYIAIAYFIGYWSFSQMNGSHSLRRHLNGPFTLAYFLTGQIGLLGVLFYKVNQTIGSLIAGGVLSALVRGGYTGRLPVPFPVTTESSLTTAVCLEIFVTAVVVLFLLIVEFVNTADEAREKNYRKAMKSTALFMAVTVLVLYQFQAWTFNDNVYLTGLFAGFGQSDALLTVGSMAQLSAPGYVNSVFSGGNAWALYYFGPWAGGIIGALIFWVFFWLFARGGIAPLPQRMEGYRGPVPFGSEVAASEQQAESHLDQLINPLLKK